MRKYLIIFILCISTAGLYSCASSKKNNDGMTAAQRKQEKEAARREAEKKGPAQQEVKIAPEPNTKSRTMPVPLENK